MKQQAHCLNNLTSKRREKKDRRNLRFKTFVNSFYKGQRENARRQEEIKQGYYVDRYEGWISFVALAVVLLSALDAFFTLSILEKGGDEVNPFMSFLLSYDTQTFLIGKMGITVICVLFALVHINFHVFKVVSMKLMLSSVLVIYIILIGYELTLITTIELI